MQQHDVERLDCQPIFLLIVIEDPGGSGGPCGSEGHGGSDDSEGSERSEHSEGPQGSGGSSYRSLSLLTGVQDRLLG